MRGFIGVRLKVLQMMADKPEVTSTKFLENIGVILGAAA